MSRRVLIDADACPRQALRIAEELCAGKGWRCITYATIDHYQDRADHIVVDPGPEAVDLRLANDATAGDIVITQDIGLAALVMGKKARALSVLGHLYDPDTIPFQLEVRHERARHRRAGGKTPGIPPRTAEDDRQFALALRQLMEEGGNREPCKTIPT
ncbi:DUF188 domain-containing protein [Brevibacillus humidisoli]|uniref:DUF188 domain-containing protein n=1 Tax=Brevibacillus humidisoli TaxID=2895522 RepID=UPI001E3D2F62|nr:DUF188 domain-containing protein [Brevibacillus humidisoli]UFJ42975.1 DUF188 domain-containing protein [Brevibacillus humidisoli]